MIWEKSLEIPHLPAPHHALVVYGNHRQADLSDMHLILTDDELAFAKRFRVTGQKNTWISCRKTLRLMLGEWLNLDPKSIEFRRNRFGKLYLAGSNLFFNVSHTDSSFLIGFAFNGKIGVDLDKLNGGEELNPLIAYAFSDQETGFCRNGTLPDRFLEIWTLKEAFLKAAGVGLVDNLKAVNVSGKSNNQLMIKDFSHSTFKCPSGETASIVFRNSREIRYIWLC